MNMILYPPFPYHNIIHYITFHYNTIQYNITLHYITIHPTPTLSINLSQYFFLSPWIFSTFNPPKGARGSRSNTGSKLSAMVDELLCISETIGWCNITKPLDHSSMKWLQLGNCLNHREILKTCSASWILLQLAGCIYWWMHMTHWGANCENMTPQFFVVPSKISAGSNFFSVHQVNPVQVLYTHGGRMIYWWIETYWNVILRFIR